MGFPGGSDGKESTCNVGIPGRRVQQSIPVFLPGESPWKEKIDRLYIVHGVSKSWTQLSD